MRNIKNKISYILLISVLFTLIFFSLAAAPVHALSIGIHVPEKYTDVKAGERVYFEIDVKYPENPTRKDLRLQYKITKDGEIVAQAKVLKAVETQASFIDFIVVPEIADKGLHTIQVEISDYADLKEEVSTTFHVASKGSELMIYFFILLGAIVLVGGLVVWQGIRLEYLDKESYE